MSATTAQHITLRLHGRKRYQFVGPGENIVLRTAAADAMFVWRNYIDDTIPKQDGIECAVFRNEGPRAVARRSLSDRLTPSLISRGLVRGITPRSSGSSAERKSWILFHQSRMEDAAD
jgi:hypothetical protein